MSNAVRCLAYVIQIADQLPDDRVVKGHLFGVAGALFFNDCLMAKMSGGFISITTNELRQSFSNAVIQAYGNRLPPELAAELAYPSPSVDSGDLSKMYERDKRLGEHTELSMANSFNSGFSDRNNMRISVDDQYQRMKLSTSLAHTLNTIDSAFQQAGISDASQSDLKEMCLGIGESRTSAFLIYGSESDTPMPETYDRYAQSLNKLLRWRLVNMYGLDDPAADALMQALSRVPVTGFSHGGLQPPALIQ
jgi:hypothetical protein